MTRKITLETLAKQIAQGFAKQSKGTKDLTDSLAFVVKHMATKEETATKDQMLALQTQVNSIERQLRETKSEIRLGNLEETVFGAARD
jgi:polyhydroxyalkanoate synthesis regulator phasin